MLISNIYWSKKMIQQTDHEEEYLVRVCVCEKCKVHCIEYFNILIMFVSQKSYPKCIIIWSLLNLQKVANFSFCTWKYNWVVVNLACLNSAPWDKGNKIFFYQMKKKITISCVPFLFFLYRSCLWICWLNPLYFWCKEGCQLWYMGPLQVQNQDRLLPLLNFRKNRLNDYMDNSQPTEIENTLLSWGNEMRKKKSFPL